jgi:glycosyltransferase involved in cell wall biosynthesis
VQPAHGAFPELIEATGGGILFPPNDHVALAERIAALMDDAATRLRLGAAGRAAVRERFSDRHMADATWDIYGRYVARNT